MASNDLNTFRAMINFSNYRLIIKCCIMSRAGEPEGEIDVRHGRLRDVLVHMIYDDVPYTRYYANNSSVHNDDVV